MNSPQGQVKSLYSQLLIALVVLVMIATVLVSFVNFLYTSRESDATFEKKILSYSNSLHDSLEWPLWNVDDELANKIGTAFASNTDIASLTIFDDQQRLIFQQATPTEHQIKRIIIIEHEGKRIGNVELGLSLQSVEEQNKRLVINSLISMLLIIVSLLLALRWLLGRLLKKPVDNLVGVIGEVIEGKYPQIDPSKTYKEFGPIVSYFKIMSDAVASRETSLRASEQKMLNILESVDAYIYLKDMEGRYLFANRPVRELWQAEMKDIIGFTDDKFFDAATAANIRLNDRRVLLGGKTLKTEEVNTVPSTGKSLSFQSTKLPLRREDGSIYALCGISFDVTERKQREKETIEIRDQLAQATKMESIGHLTAGIAHDFNNMLGAMMGYTELSQHMMAAGKPDTVRPYLEEILKAGTRAKELIAQMLAFSRTSSDKNGGLEPVILLTPILKEVFALLRSTIPTTVDLNYQIEADDLKVRILPVHLHQIILNLGVNARDAISEYGKIDITLSRYHGDNQLCVACKNHFSGDYAKISVKDSGSGIPEHIINKIFDPFFTTKGVGKGTGMGLSVVHGLVRAVGGHILLKSSATSGTTFEILLPLVKDALPLQHATEAPVEVNVQGTRIMVVDDELPLATMLHKYLQSYGAQVVSFTDPTKALESFIQNTDNIDLVITDEAMPGLSGMLLAEKLLQAKPGLPIILCTGYSDHATPETVAKIGIAGFFYKPLNMKELIQKIHTLSASKTQSSSNN